MSQPAEDSTDLRSGPTLHDALLALLPLVGVWQGAGRVRVASTGEEYDYGQRLTISHDGRPFLAHGSQTWLVDAEGNTIRQAFRESGFWRPGAGPDDVELQLADAAGLIEVFTGVAGTNQWELTTTTVAGTPTARAVSAERRLYAVVGDELAYATELAVESGQFAPHLNARLRRQR